MTQILLKINTPTPIQIEKLLLFSNKGPSSSIKSKVPILMLRHTKWIRYFISIVSLLSEDNRTVIDSLIEESISSQTKDLFCKRSTRECDTLCNKIREKYIRIDCK